MLDQQREVAFLPSVSFESPETDRTVRPTLLEFMRHKCGFFWSKKIKTLLQCLLNNCVAADTPLIGHRTDVPLNCRLAMASTISFFWNSTFQNAVDSNFLVDIGSAEVKPQ